MRRSIGSRRFLPNKGKYGEFPRKTRVFEGQHEGRYGANMGQIWGKYEGNYGAPEGKYEAGRDEWRGANDE